MTASPAPVTIVGAGSTGVTLALLLARRGIRTVLLDRRTEPLAHPAAHVLHSRSLEIWHSAAPELAAEIAAMAPPIEDVSLIRWAGPFDHPHLGELDLTAEKHLVERVKSHSPFLLSHIGQHLLMPVLWRAVEREPLVDFRPGHSVESVDLDGPGGATVHVRTADGTADRWPSRFVVAADGANSRLREQAGVGMVGPVLAHMGSVFFRARDLYPAGTPKPLLTWIYQPSFAGVLIAHADDDYILMTAYLHPEQPIARDSHRYWVDRLPRALGAGVDVTIHSTSRWSMTSQLADAFRRGPLFLAGDAAHRFPHTGGFGLNSGVQDAQNLAWKLSAVLRGAAGPHLLDTYETERRPVVEMLAKQSTENHFRLDELAGLTGVSNLMLHYATTAFGRPPFNRLPGRAMARLADVMTTAQLQRTRVLTSPGRRGRKVRAEIEKLVAGQTEHFVSTGLELGYAYDGPLIATEPGGQPVGLDEVLFYRPTTWPGARLPHAVLAHDGTASPVHDLLDPDHLTLITASPEAWAEVVDEARDGGAPWTVRILPLATPEPGDLDAAVQLYEVGGQGAVLVRPDGHVAWRTPDDARTAGPDLHRVLDTIWTPFLATAAPDRS